ncbi:MAG: hypothetical protein WC732_05815 [Candidatus Omnitrophota bacterium]
MARMLREVLGGSRGQSLLEYSILVAIVAAAFTAMALYVRQAVQGKIHSMDDRVVARRNVSQGVWVVPI